MNTRLITLTLVAATGPLAANLQAQDRLAGGTSWISVGPQFGLNIDARLSHVGNGTPASPGPATGGGVSRTYDNGFVLVDSSGNLGGQTWNWGYQNSSQVQGNTLTFHSASAAVNGTLHRNDDPQPGFDLAFGRSLGIVAGGKWGLQAAFDFTAVSIHGDQSLDGTGLLISDTYSLGTITVPEAPYTGSFNGPGPLLSDTPTRNTSGQITSHRGLDAEVYCFRVGPYYEFSFSQRWSGRLGGGLALAVADTDYSFDETLTFGDGQVIHNAGSDSGAEFLVGGYLEGRFLYSLNSHLSLFAGAQYEYLGTASCNAGNERARLDLRAAVNVLFGAEWKF